MWYLGIDTSNYTTSTALYNAETGEMLMQKKLLPVKEQQVGLRQSDAVFLHVKQLAGLMRTLLQERNITLSGIGVSAYPRNVEGSYMPCFLVGEMVADVLSAALQIPLSRFSHQEGHLAAAIHSAGCSDFFYQDFYAFHVSGGTTEGLAVSGNGTGFSIDLQAKTLDLNAGQVIDRVGVLLGLPFPCGKPLEQLALNASPCSARATLKGADCCLSGLENQCRKKLQEGNSPEVVARFCLETVKMTIAAMTERLLEREKRPVLYAGGVMSNGILREYLQKKFNAFFAEPQFSTDNSGGIAVLAARTAKH